MKPERCEEIFECAERHARSLGVRDVEALVDGHASALTRFANNTIHQNMAEQSGHLSVRVLLDGRTARAGTNRLEEESIRRTVDEAVSLARLQEPDADLLPLAEPESLVQVSRYFADTAGVTPRERAQRVAEAIDAVRAHS